MNKKLLITGVVLIALIVIVVINKQGSIQNDSSDKLQVSTSFYPLYYFATQIGGDKAQVYNITPAGAEPHDYEPTIEDMIRLEKSKIIFLNGGKLESWGEKIKENLAGKNISIAAIGEKFMDLHIEDNGEILTDPHIWLSPKHAKEEVGLMLQNFLQVDPLNKDYYQTRAQELKEKLDKLDTSFELGLKNCQKKDFVTSHAAFGYLAQAYQLNQVAISGLSPDNEPSAQALIEVARFAKEHNVQYIFFESLVSSRLAETLANEVGAKTLVLNPLEGLTEEEQRAGKNYITEMEHNLINLQIALACS